MPDKEKIDAYKRYMTKRHVGTSTSCPPLWRFLWALGWSMPPPPFMGFVSLFVLTGTTFGSMWGALMWLASYRGLLEMSRSHLPVAACMAGVFFGVVMAAYYRNLARKHALGSLSEFSGDELD